MDEGYSHPPHPGESEPVVSVTKDYIMTPETERGQGWSSPLQAQLEESEHGLDNPKYIFMGNLKSALVPRVFG